MRKVTCFLVALLLLGGTTWGQTYLQENFNAATGTTPPAGWQNVVNPGGNAAQPWQFSSTSGTVQGPSFGGVYAILNSDAYGSGNTQNASLISPSFSTVGSTAVRAIFGEQFRPLSPSTGTLEVSIDGGATWSVVFVRTLAVGYPNPGATTEVNLPMAINQANVQLKFTFVGTYAWWWAIDNVVVEQTPSCLPPTALNVTGLTTTSANLGWTPGQAETTWNIEWGPAGFTQGTGTLISGVTNNPYTLAGLNIMSSYAFYVQADCGGGDLSIWAGPVNFQTLANPLSGSYTVNSTLPTGGMNFNNFTDLAGALNTGGFAGPVVVDVVAGTGPYTEQVILGQLPNSSNVNTLTINGNGETLQFLSANTNERATLKMNGTDYVTIDNMVFKSLGTTTTEYGFTVQLMNGANYNTFTNCHFITDKTTTSLNYAPFVTSNSATSATTAGLAANYLTVDNCIVEGGYYGLVVNGPSSGTPLAMNNVITNNEVKDFHLYGIYVRGNYNSIISGNVSSRPTRTTTGALYMIYLVNENSGVQVTKNLVKEFSPSISNTSTAYGIFGTSLTAQVDNPLLIANNIMYDYKNMNGALYGIYLSTTAALGNVDLYHNTVLLDNTSHSGSGLLYCFYHTGATANLDLKNNIFSYTATSTGAKYNLYFVTNTAVVSSNYNVLHRGAANGTPNTGYWSATPYATLANWQTANGGIYDLMSNDSDPLFVNSAGGNLMPQNGSIDNMGTDLLAIVPDDFFGVARTTTPDPGAIEFEPADCLPPTALTATEITTTSALLGWTPVGIETSWNVEYGSTGFTIGGGTFVEGAANPYPLSGLAPATVYDFYVQADCGGSVSLWAGPFTFMTDCEPFALPLAESFDDPMFPPTCWTNAYIAGTGAGLWNRSTSGTSPIVTPYSGAGMAFYNSFSFGSGTIGILVSPPIDITASSVVVRFWMFRDDGYLTNADRVNVHYNTAPELTDATLLGTVNRSRNLEPVVASNGWYEYTFAAPGGILGDVGYFIFEGVSAFGNNMYIDEIDIFEVIAGSVSGNVSEATRGVIEGARVFSGVYETYTDEFGNYEITGMIPGTYALTAEADDYFPVTIEGVEVLPNLNTVVDFELGYAQITVNPTILEETLEPGETSTKILTISNPGGTEPLTWSAGVEILDETRKGNIFNPSNKQNSVITKEEAEINPNPAGTSPEATRAQFDLLDWFPLSATTGHTQYSIATDGEFIYSGAWNTNNFAKYTMDGTYISSFAVTGAGLTRDLTYDGQYFYGSPNSAVIYQMDFNTQTLISTITATGSQIRGIAYDADNDGFWVTGASFNGPFRLISRTGAVLQTVTPAFGGISGIAYDNTTGDPSIWAYIPALGNGVHTISQVSIATGATLQTYNVSDNPIFIGTGTSGGLTITDLIVPGKWTFLGVSQNELAWVVELGDATPPWLTIDPKSGTVLPGESVEVVASFDATGLTDTTYYANINISHNGQMLAKGEVTVPVELTVASLTVPALATLVSPANNSTLVPLQPTFTWVNGPRTAFNRVVITTGNPPFQTTVFQSDWFLGESFDLSTTAFVLDLKKTYDWRVRSRNAAGTVSTASWKFTTIGAGTIQGTVTDAYSGQPLQGVTITAEELRYSVETGANGTYIIPGVLEGTYEVTASFPFYVDQTQQTTVQHNGNSIVNFALNLFLAPPLGLQATVQNVYDVHLEWIEPGTGFPPAWLTYFNTYSGNSIGTGAAANFDVAIRFIPDQLSGFPGGSVTKVKFIPGEPVATSQYTIKIWQGTTPPTLIYSQPVTAVTVDAWNEVILTNPVPFNNNQELWIGFNCNTTAGYPAGCDGGPHVEGFGNMMFWNGAWTTLFQLAPTLTFNWGVEGYVESVKGAGVLSPVEDNPVVFKTDDIPAGSPVKADPTAVNNYVNQTAGGKALLGYNVYRDGVLLANTAGTTYNDLGLDAGVYSYEVTSVYDEGESDPVGPKVVSILAPPTLITAEQVGDAINLEWVSNFVGKGDNATAEEAISVSNVADRMAATSKEERLHGPTTRVPQATESRAVGDDCIDPIVVGALPYIDVNTTCGRGNTYDLTCLGSYDGGEDIIYKLVLTETKVLEVAMSTTTTWTGMLISNECPPVNCIAFGTNTSAGGVTIIEELAAGTYYIMMDTYPAPDCIPNFTLTIEEIIPEPGQTCATAVTAIEGLNTAPSAPYWYSFTPATNGLLTISSCLEGQLVDTDLVVWDACGGAIVAANDDLLTACGFYQYASAVSFPAQAGVTYKIQWLDTWTTNGFSFTIDLGDLCVVECPTGAIIETELCGEDTNGGCNGVPNAFDPIEIGDVICGTSYADAGSRDTDWYQLVIDSPKLLTWTVVAEFPVYAFIIDGNSGCDASVIIGTIGQADPCEPAVASAIVAPGTYWLWVGAQFFEGYPCGSQNNYVAELTAEDAFLPFFTLYRNGAEYADVYDTEYVDENIVPGESYCYTVTETPEEGITTGPSNELCVEIPLYGELAVNPDELFEVHAAAPELTTQTIMVTNNGDGVMEFEIESEILGGDNENRESGLCVTGLFTTGCTDGDGAIQYQFANVSVPQILCSGTTPAWYKDFTDMVHVLEPGQTYDLTITAGFASNHFTMWIDWNNDLLLTADEIIGSGSLVVGNAPVVFPLTIPASAPTGTFVMRVITNYGSIPLNPCGPYTWGNVLDFTATTGSPWLTFEPAMGTLNPGASMPVEVTFNSNGLEYGTYNANLLFNTNDPFSAQPEVVVPVELIVALPSQDILLPLGWSGWSSYIDPAMDAAFVDVIAPVVDDMIITQHFSNLFYPAYGINTMGDFTNAHGYVSKMSAEAVLSLEGMMAAPVVNLNAGWNLFPILAPCNLSAAEVFGGVTGLIIAYEVAGNGIYYPAMGINTLVTLVPGKAYWVKVTGATEYTFPACAKNASSSWVAPLRHANTTPWNEVSYTGISHVVAFDATASSGFVAGDIIGAFTANGTCAGITIYDGKAASLALFGNDITTAADDGFAEGEQLNFKVYRAANETEYILDVTYSTQAPNYDGTFAASGVSVINDITMTATGIGSPELNGLSIYPNPSQGMFNVAIDNLPMNISYTVSDAKGQAITSGKLAESQVIDLTSQPKGVYFIRFTGDNVLRIEKLVIR